MSELAGILKEILIMSGDGTRAAKVADMAGVSRATVYAQADEKCNPSTQVVAAAYAVTGDTRLRAALTPPGYRIVISQEAVIASKPLPEEINDICPALGDWTRLITTPGSDSAEADTLKSNLIREIEEAHKAFRRESGLSLSLKAVGDQ